MGTGYRKRVVTGIAVALLLGTFVGVEPRPRGTVTEALAAAQAPSKGEKRAKLDVGYQPTPYEIVEKMLTMADVQKTDIVYDLGCGDGRVVVMAAKARGARGVGIDLDPARIRESKENARKAGVADRVRFLRQDLFKTEIREATVVMLYLWPEVNVRLRPKLFAELEPGTRVLSHNHDMGEWKPDQYAELAKHRIYSWIVPANIAGSWTGPVTLGQRTANASLRLQQSFQRVTGTFTLGNSTVPITSAELRGRELTLSAETVVDGNRAMVRLAALVEGESLQGAMEISGVTAGGGSAWKAQRGKEE